MTTPDITPAHNGPMKDRLLQSAMDSLRDLDPQALLHAIGARNIARRAGASSPAIINHHYGSLAGLADAVVERVFDTTHLNPPRINELITHIKDSTLPLTAAFAMHEAEYTRLTTDDEFKLRMGLWSLGGASVTARYGAYLRELDALLKEAASELFDSWGRELRDPIDIDAYLALKVALINGITVRQFADPDDQRLHLFQRATVAIDLVLLRVKGDRHDLDARLAELNYYPLTKKTKGPNQRSHKTVARILRAANELFNTQGVDLTGIDQIAKQADIGLTTLKRYYPTKQDLAIALFRLQATEHLNTTHPATPTTPANLREHLKDLATFARARTPYATAYLAHLATTTADKDDPILTSVREHLTTHTTTHTTETAESLVVLILRRALTRPAEPAYQTVAHVLDLGNTTRA